MALAYILISVRHNYGTINNLFTKKFNQEFDKNIFLKLLELKEIRFLSETVFVYWKSFNYSKTN